MSNSENLAQARQDAAHYAVDTFITSNSIIGLGTGRTANLAIKYIGEKLKNGDLENIFAIPTSVDTHNLAKSLNIPITTLEEHSQIDIALDGADEVILENFQLLKGRGGALLREKLVEECAKKFIVMIDESKIVSKFGETGGIPVEVNCFGSDFVTQKISKIKQFEGSKCQLRLKDGQPFLTDNHNYIIDVSPIHTITEATSLAQALKNLTGVVEHGFFIGMATHCVIAKLDGQITQISYQDIQPK